MLGGPSQGASWGSRLPPDPPPRHSRAGLEPGCGLGPLEGLPSLIHEVRALSPAGKTALLGGRGAKGRTRGECHTPFLAARRGPGGWLPAEPWLWRSRPPQSFADGLAYASCHLLSEISPGDRSPRPLRPRSLLTPSRESPVVFARPGQARGAPSLCTLLLEGGHWMGPWICRLVDSVRVHGQRVMWGWLPAITSKPPELL